MYDDVMTNNTPPADRPHQILRQEVIDKLPGAKRLTDGAAVATRVSALVDRLARVTDEDPAAGLIVSDLLMTQLDYQLGMIADGNLQACLRSGDGRAVTISISFHPYQDPA